MLTIIILVLVVLAIGILGSVAGGLSHGLSWADWGYGPSGVVGLILVIILVLWLTGHRL